MFFVGENLFIILFSGNSSHSSHWTTLGWIHDTRMPSVLLHVLLYMPLFLVLGLIWWVRVHRLLAITPVQSGMDGVLPMQVDVIRSILLLLLHQKRHTLLLVILIVSDLGLQFGSFRFRSAS